MKARHRRAVPVATAAATAGVLALSMGAAPAMAGASATAAAPYRACSASQMSMTVPKSTAGDPYQGMSGVIWNILLRNTGGTQCSLAGWPGLTVAAAGRQVAITSQKVPFSNLAQIRPQRIAVGAGQQAVVTVQSGPNTRGCQAGWDLTLRLPNGAGSLTSSQPGDFFGPCAGGVLRLSPFYPRSSLAKSIREVQVAQSPPPYRTTNSRLPAPCTPRRLRVAASSGQATHGGTVEVLRLTSRGSACVLAGQWPTMTLRGSGGASQIAKAQIAKALSAVPSGVTQSPMTGYRQAGSVKTDLTLSHGTSASLALVTQTTGSRACHVATTGTIYPGLTSTGAGLTVALPRPLKFCGLPRVLPYLAGRPSAGSLTAAVRALAGGVSPDGDSPSGFWYGSDSNAPVPCGSCSQGGVWQMPNAPGSASYGGYVGELGDYGVWQGCYSGINWNQTGYNDAENNLKNHNVGVGAGSYWMMGGPGREPGGYNSSASRATSWGRSQGERAVADVGQTLGFAYIFMDIEDVFAHGWNEGFSGVCSGTETAGSIPVALDRDTFNGFFNYVNNTSAFFPAVYEAGGGGPNSWSGVFGSQVLGNTGEWTYVNETSSISSFPHSWSVGGTSPGWFASAPGKCQLLWQWSGGNGQTNGVGDFDQIDGNRKYSCQ